MRRYSRWWENAAGSGVNAGSILLVDSVNNRTNGSLNAGEATRNAQCAERNGKFTLVSAQQLAWQTAAGPVAAG
jgi:PBP1b-binding outer membrane lipoprotein LpoB